MAFLKGALQILLCEIVQQGGKSDICFEKQIEKWLVLKMDLEGLKID